MGKHLSLDKKSEIVAWSKVGKSGREIAKLMGIARPTVQKILKKNSDQGTVERAFGSGRSCGLNSTIKNILWENINKDSTMSARDHALKVNREMNTEFSRRTINNYLNEIGCESARPLRKPLLTATHKANRLRASKEWIMWSDERWKRVIFSDETKINLRGSDGITHIWRKKGDRLNPKNIIPTVKFGGGCVMFWGCFGYNGVGNLVVIEGTMDRFLYLDILNNNLRVSAEKLGVNDFIFQQDNDPKHTAGLIGEFFERNGIHTMYHPSQSPDLNPIEHLWSYIKGKLVKKNFTKKSDLIDAVVEEWNAIPVSLCQSLVMSMKKRAKACILAKGGYIDY